MKYQIYLAKDVSEIINNVAKTLKKKPSTMIKEMLENNFRIAYQDALKSLDNK